MLRALLQRMKPPRRLLVPAARVADADAKLGMDRVGHIYPNRVVALQDVNLNIRSGEFVCLLGPSGCGKSTLLYALAGHLTPSGGRVSIDGKPVKGPGPDRLLMFQDAALFPWMTVKGNLTFALAARGVAHAERETRARTFIDRVGLSGFENALPHQLSGGMKMRTSLARALAMDSAVLLMDEPFGSLDAQTRVHMHELLQHLWLSARKTVVFVTHDVHEALQLATRVVVMAPRPGRVLQDLQVQLPMPRSPDSPELAEMARHIRELLRRVELPPALEALEGGADEPHPSAGREAGRGRPAPAVMGAPR
ncbi:ABC transporter ATP-binding protein [Aggregicoccus sp. 17bor-14]|uniref:ABC transporter ATP-binding protein n=1 Tax=Myxococcaceae TaxID=31 RepID=UPI00129C848E|nr:MULTISPECIES: ABC transporter ATP-binding protein [Myxococcaceae]MBF5045820.1 ABC transporter ATP-binding protein [Simulacricoccus sp. 17bor-14]MRI91555.1 ABC transporter ATP-binding protein [Aggregicoccus sp. 17bor-14]